MLFLEQFPLGSLGNDDCSGKQRQYWTFIDVAYHLAYFDLEVIATTVNRGLDVPIGEQVLRTRTNTCLQVSKV